MTHSKIGIGTTYSEGAIIEYDLPRDKKPPQHIKYVAVALQVPYLDMVKVIKAIDGFVQSEHPWASSPRASMITQFMYDLSVDVSVPLDWRTHSRRRPASRHRRDGAAKVKSFDVSHVLTRDA